MHDPVSGTTQLERDAYIAKRERAARIAAAAAAVTPPEPKTRRYAPTVKLPSLRFLETQKEWAERQMLIPIRTKHRAPKIEVIAEIAPDIKVPAVDSIQRIVGCYYGIDRIEIIGVARTADIVLARQVSMYLAKKMTGLSMPNIGKRFGGKDHTTVLHAVRKIEKVKAEDAKFAAELDHLKDLVGGAV
ncbi:hypothetical protein V1291_000020 [Nitrobacteraceae bacterium AZCC 1564]